MMVPQMLSTVQVLYTPKERAAVFGVVGAVSGTRRRDRPAPRRLAGHRRRVRPRLAQHLPDQRADRHADLRAGRGASCPTPRTVRCGSTCPASAGQRGLFLLMFPLIEGREQDWAGWIWRCSRPAAVVLGVFVAVAACAGSAATARRCCRCACSATAATRPGCVTQSVFQGSMAGFFLVLIVYVQAGLGFSAFDAGLMLLPFSLGAFVGTGVSVPLGLKVGKVVMFVGAPLQAIAVWWVIRIVDRRGRRPDRLEPRAADGAGRHRAGAAGGAAGRHRAGHGRADRSRSGVGHLQHVPAGRGGARHRDDRIGVLRGRRLDFTPAGLADGLASAAWVCIIGYAACAPATLLLPSRAAVRAHAEQDGRWSRRPLPDAGKELTGPLLI